MSADPQGSRKRRGSGKTRRVALNPPPHQRGTCLGVEGLGGLSLEATLVSAPHIPREVTRGAAALSPVPGGHG